MTSGSPVSGCWLLLAASAHTASDVMVWKPWSSQEPLVVLAAGSTLVTHGGLGAGGEGGGDSTWTAPAVDGATDGQPHTRWMLVVAVLVPMLPTAPALFQKTFPSIFHRQHPVGRGL